MAWIVRLFFFYVTKTCYVIRPHMELNTINKPLILADIEMKRKRKRNALGEPFVNPISLIC